MLCNNLIALTEYVIPMLVDAGGSFLSVAFPQKRNSIGKDMEKIRILFSRVFGSSFVANDAIGRDSFTSDVFAPFPIPLSGKTNNTSRSESNHIWVQHFPKEKVDDHTVARWLKVIPYSSSLKVCWLLLCCTYSITIVLLMIRYLLLAMYSNYCCYMCCVCAQ
jgi:hypothetical protein